MKEEAVIIEVDVGVPVPERRRRQALRFPWERMEVGHSFWWKVTDVTLRTYARHWAVKSGHPERRFVAREEHKRGQKVARVWRVE